ncbi:MAG: hypothetical protein JXA69_14650 [Phycisphaerae bacterium]|nr:hypothetical protein [Phycisphaerae bacterium]
MLIWLACIWVGIGLAAGLGTISVPLGRGRPVRVDDLLAAVVMACWGPLIFAVWYASRRWGGHIAIRGREAKR